MPRDGDAFPMSFTEHGRKKAAPYDAKLHLLKAAAADRRLKEADLRVLIALVDRANSDTGACFPGIRKCIAVDTSLKHRSIQVALGRLEAAGYFTRELGGGPKGANSYIIPWERYRAPLHGDASTHGDASLYDDAPTNGDADASSLHGPLHGDAHPPASRLHTPLHQHAPEQETQQEKGTREGNRLAVAGETPARSPSAVSDKAMLSEAVEAWNVMAAGSGLSQVQKLTDGRKAALRARLKDLGGMDGWDALLEKVAASSFLRGESGDRNWKADFDFVIKESKCTKIMEGAFDDPPDGGGGSSGSRLNRAFDRVIEEPESPI